MSAAAATPVERSSLLARRGTFPSDDPNQNATVLAIGDTGELLAEVGRRDDAQQSGSAGLHPGALAVIDPVTGRREVVRSMRQSNDRTQTVFAALNRDYAVWTEETGTSLAATDWTLYAASRRTEDIVQVAKARRIKGMSEIPTVPGYTIPTISGGWAYWAAAATRPGDNRPAVDLYGRPLDLHQPAKLIVRNAVRPVATHGWLYYQPYVNTETSDYAIRRRSLSTGRDELVHQARLPSHHAFTFLAALGDTVTWIVTANAEAAEPGSTVYIEDRDKTILEIAAPGESLGWPQLSERVAVFSDGNQTYTNYLFDLRTQCLHTLPAPAGGATLAGGDSIAWKTPSPKEPSILTWHFAALR